MGLLEIRYKDELYVFFRISTGVLFFMFGLMKIFGLWGMPGGAAVFNTLMWYAGWAELLIGLALVAGVLTRLASAFGVIEMIVAYYIGHVTTGGWNPAVNFGAPALLFMLAFIVTFAYGSGKASLEKKVFGKEYF